MTITDTTWTPAVLRQHRFDGDWATAGLHTIAEIVQELRGDDCMLTGNGGGQPFENDTFSMHTYCWCGGEAPGHDPECPPNFVYKPTGLTFDWYKHAGRGIHTNQRPLTNVEWFKVVVDCVRSLGVDL